MSRPIFLSSLLLDSALYILDNIVRSDTFLIFSKKSVYLFGYFRFVSFICIVLIFNFIILIIGQMKQRLQCSRLEDFKSREFVYELQVDGVCTGFYPTPFIAKNHSCDYVGCRCVVLRHRLSRSPMLVDCFVPYADGKFLRQSTLNL